MRFPDIPLSEPDVGAEEADAVAEVMRSGWISGTGTAIAEFESGMAARVRRRHVVATNSGTSAIETALRVLGVGAGDEVVVPALTFAAPALCVLAVGARPVVADVDPVTWTIDPLDVAAKITRRTKAVLAVDVLGHPCDFDRLAEIGVPVVEDAAEAHGAAYRGRPAGSFGVMSVFSFHANKAISTGEGGCLATDDDDLVTRARTIVNHGMTPAEPYVHRVVGRNFRMTNLTATIGVVQVRRWDTLVAGRIRTCRAYHRLLADVEGCAARPVADWATHSCWLHCILCDRRDDLLAHLRSRGIDARALWPSLTRQPVLAGHRSRCPVAEDLAARGVMLPTSSRMSNDQIRRVTDEIRRFHGQ